MPATDETAPRADSRRRQLTADFHAQTAQIPFAELQRFFAGGRLICVNPGLDLVEVAVELAVDNRACFEAWLGAGRVCGISDELARRWLREKAVLWAVVAEPWVLVQESVDPS